MYFFDCLAHSMNEFEVDYFSLSKILIGYSLLHRPVYKYRLIFFFKHSMWILIALVKNVQTYSTEKSMNIKNDISQVRINHLLKNISNKIFTIKLISNEHQNKCESLAVQVYTYQNICFTSILSVVSNRKKNWIRLAKQGLK